MPHEKHFIKKRNAQPHPAARLGERHAHPVEEVAETMDAASLPLFPSQEPGRGR
jgi:hypothetical protein